MASNNGTTTAGPSTSSTFIPISTTSILPTTVTSVTTAPISTFTPQDTPSSLSTVSSVFTSVSTDPGTTSAISAPIVTSLVTQTATTSGGSPVVIVITSTEPAAPPPTQALTSSSSSAASTTSTSAGSFVSGGAATQKSSGLNSGGRTAIAVVVPIVAVAILILVALFFWRRRRQNKDAEDQRRKELEEYGFNPNNDPKLPAVGSGSANGDEVSEMRENDGSGYRGWGTTSSNTRKASTTLSSGNGPIGMAISDSGSNPGGYHNTSPGATYSSDVHSGDPLVGSPNDRPTSAASETLGALGAAPNAMDNRADRDIHRGPSNASSAYSGANRSESSDPPHSGSMASPQYYNEGMYFDYGANAHGPYGDGSYGGGAQPVIRDVSARRNTRIETPTTLPQQGNAGIAQNF